MANSHYDVIIIGGRCAGASLALRLADNDLNILLVDRATFPSQPNVPSAPFIHPGTMRLLDDLGLDESDYAHDGSRVDRFVVRMSDLFEAQIPIAGNGLDRDYFCGIDRSRFDATLWNHAARASGVNSQAGFSVTQINKDATGHVSGITGQATDGRPTSFTADLVVGADGRFSFSARQFGASVIEEQNDHTSAVYIAEWENVADHSSDSPNAITSYYSGKGHMILVVPIARQKYHIGTVMKSAEANFGARGVEQAYEQTLQRIPHLWQRLTHGQRMNDVVGMRPIENGYRQAYGKNWALVGDAVHYKDPTDGQGIYDALLGSKLLAQAIIDWKQDRLSWEQAGATYQERLLEATHTLFKQTVANVKQTLYVAPPDFILNTFGRYLITNPDYQTRFVRYLSRALDPAEFQPGPKLFLKAFRQGIAADIRKQFSSQ